MFMGKVTEREAKDGWTPRELRELADKGRTENAVPLNEKAIKRLYGDADLLEFELKKK